MLALIMVVILLMSVVPGLGCSEQIEFPDTNLELVIREAIGKTNGRISITNLKDITSLEAVNKDISDLSGLEKCISLESLSLSYNRIRI